MGRQLPHFGDLHSLFEEQAQAGVENQRARLTCVGGGYFPQRNRVSLEKFIIMDKVWCNMKPFKPMKTGVFGHFRTILGATSGKMA